MSKLQQVMLSLFFLFMIYAVPVTQALVEVRRGETIQFFDAIEDTFLTPVRSGKEVAALFGELRQTLLDIGTKLEKVRNTEPQEFWVSTDIESRAEEALYNVADIRKSVLAVNRHRTGDSTRQRILLLDSLSAKVEDYYDNISAQGSIGELLTEHKGITGYLSLAQKRFPKPGILSYPVLATKIFFVYTIFNREYLRKYEGELEETSVFANSLRPPMQFLRYTFLHDLGEKALEGKNGWLFYKPGVQYLMRPYILEKRASVVDPEDDAIRENAVDTIVAFQKELAKRNIELLVVIVPGKASVYPDMLSEKLGPEDACTMSHTQRILASLRDKGVSVVDLFPVFREARKDDEKYGDSLYMARDTHWKNRGPRLAAGAVAEQIRKYAWFGSLAEKQVEYVTEEITVDRYGDVGAMSALPEVIVHDLHMSFEVEPTVCNQVYRIRRDEEGGVVSKTLYKDDFRNAGILVIGDSFSRMFQTDEPRSAGWISHLAKELSQPLASIVSDGGASTLVREKLARKKNVLRGKKLVVWEFVERDLRYGAEGWKDIRL